MQNTQQLRMLLLSSLGWFHLFFRYNMQLQEKKQFPDVGVEGVTVVVGASDAEYTTRQIPPVPESSTLLLLGSGLVWFGLFGRKNLKNN